MKFLFAFLAIVTLSACTLQLHADPIISLQTNGVTDTLVATSVAGGEQYKYLNVATSVLQTTVQTFTATFTDIAGVALLNVNDVCANVNILAPAQPCSALAFSYTDATLGTANLLSVLGVASATANGSVAGVNFGASIGGGSAQFGFTPPPSASPVPEPGTLSLLGTGLLGLGGVLRRRMLAGSASV